MPLVYRAADLIEAQLVMDELRAAGLSPRLSGSYLGGAIGELPPTELIGVWIDEPRHRERARDIIDAFELARRQPERDWFCGGCGERLGREFGACWHCGRVRVDQA